MLAILPAELISYISEYLSVRDMANCSLTNKYLKECIDGDIFFNRCRKLYINSNKNRSKFIEKLIKYPSYCARFGISDFFLNSIINVVETFFCRSPPPLTALCIYSSFNIDKLNKGQLANSFLRKPDKRCFMLFKIACVEGEFRLAKKILAKIDPLGKSIQHAIEHLNEINCNYITDCKICAAGHNLHLENIFVFVCGEGHYDIARWIHELVPQIVTIKCDRMKNAYEKAAINNMILIVEWLENETRYIGEYINDTDYNSLLDRVFKNYSFEVASFLISSHDKIKLPKNPYLIVQKNNIKHSVPNIIFFTSKSTIRFFCMKYSNVNISSHNEYIFRYICEYGDLEIVKYIIELYPKINIRVLNDKPFRIACAKGKYDIASFLINKYPDINIRAKQDYAYKKACENNHIGIIYLLTTLNPKYLVRKIDYEIID